MLSARERIEQKVQEKNNDPNHSFQPKINFSSTFLSETNPDRLIVRNQDKFKRLYDYKDKMKENRRKLQEEE